MRIYKRPEWLSQGIVSAGAWEPLIARRRSGRAWVDEEKWYEIEHSERVVKRLARLGVNTIISTLHKGFGLKAEKPEMEYTRRLVEHAHKHGLKVGVYIRWDNIITECILSEVPEARQWLRVNQDGKTVGYDYYRHFICFNSKGYENYLKKIVAYEIAHIKADMIYFDGGTFGFEGETSCFCKTCRKKFFAFLKKKYGAHPRLARERFGFSDLSHVEPPPLIPSRPIATIDAVRDPVRQEWMAFRCKSFTEFHHRISRFIKRKDPNVAMLINSGVNFLTVNKAFYSGVDVAGIAEENDVIFDENMDIPSVTDNGVLVSHVPYYKMARTVNNILIGYHIHSRTGRQVKLSMAEAMVFNGGTIGEITGGFNLFPENLPFYGEKKAFLKFYREHKSLVLGAETLANVAVWASSKSLALNNITTHQGIVLVLQTLLAGHVPFDIVLDKDLKDLSKYSVLILPNVESMDREEIKSVEKYIRSGGGVVATEATSQFDAWYRMRRRGGLLNVLDKFQKPDVIEVFDPYGRGLSMTISAGKKAKANELRETAGKGRFAYIAEIIRSMPMKSIDGWKAHDNPSKYWKLPKNYKQVLNAVKGVGRNSIPLRTNAPATVLMEMLYRKSNAAVTIHLLNYDLDGPRPGNIKVEIDLPSGASCRAPFLLELDKGKRPAKWKRLGDKVSFAIPRLDLYSAIVIQ